MAIVMKGQERFWSKKEKCHASDRALTLLSWAALAIRVDNCTWVSPRAGSWLQDEMTTCYYASSIERTSPS